MDDPRRINRHSNHTLEKRRHRHDTRFCREQRNLPHVPGDVRNRICDAINSQAERIQTMKKWNIEQSVPSNPHSPLAQGVDGR